MDSVRRRLVALFVAGLAAFYSPVLVAFNRREELWGIPLMPLYLFAVWTGLVLAAALLIRGTRR